MDYVFSWVRIHLYVKIFVDTRNGRRFQAMNNANAIQIKATRGVGRRVRVINDMIVFIPAAIKRINRAYYIYYPYMRDMINIQTRNVFQFVQVKRCAITTNVFPRQIIINRAIAVTEITDLNTILHIRGSRE